jgi:hypothetical protein
MKHLNTPVIEEIVKKLPNRRRLVNYLMDTLDLGKESAYRRIKNQIPFTFNEVVTIANDLNFSIDKVTKCKTSIYFSFDEELHSANEPEDVYLAMLRRDHATMEQMLTSSGYAITATLNRIPFHFFPYQSLFKFAYYHYLYSVGKISLMTHFSDIKIPGPIADLYEKNIAAFNRLDNITCILDSLIYSKIISEIQYYYRLKFISEDDLRALQTELFELLDMYENLLRKGKSVQGSNFTIYYSLLNLDSNSIFIEYDDNFSLYIWIYPESPIAISNNRCMYEIQKRWVDSKIRNSMLISKTNDTMQIEMLREIYKQISNLTKVE